MVWLRPPQGSRNSCAPQPTAAFRMNHLPKSLHHLIRRPRLLLASCIGLVTFALLSAYQPIAFAGLVGFDVAASLFLLLIGILTTRANTASMRHRARIQADNKWVVLLASLSVAAVVIIALYSELHAAKDKSLGTILLASATILLAWLFVATMFAQQYAHDFYTTPGQLVFPGAEHPNYWDFTYFAVVLSMCCQTSDIAITSTNMRRLVMLHSVVSFFFNVIIIAITVGVVAGAL